MANIVLYVVTRTNKREYITTIFASLHWLPVDFGIDFKVLFITFKALHVLAPA